MKLKLVESKSPSVCGLDEAGRGALAGPMVIAAVMLQSDFKFGGVAPKIVFRDSKKMSRLQRDRAYQVIEKYSLKIEIEIVSVTDINQVGIHVKNRDGFIDLINRNNANKYIVDGRWKFHNLGEKSQHVYSIIDADSIYPATIAAGIVAKCTRDKIMLKLHNKYSNYGWNTNVGYGTLEHINAIHKFGINEYHRLKFVETALKNSL